jgi:hypothetical protein
MNPRFVIQFDDDVDGTCRRFNDAWILITGKGANAGVASHNPASLGRQNRKQRDYSGFGSDAANVAPALDAVRV